MKLVLNFGICNAGIRWESGIDTVIAGPDQNWTERDWLDLVARVAAPCATRRMTDAGRPEQGPKVTIPENIGFYMRWSEITAIHRIEGCDRQKVRFVCTQDGKDLKRRLRRQASDSRFPLTRKFKMCTPGSLRRKRRRMRRAGERRIWGAGGSRMWIGTLEEEIWVRWDGDEDEFCMVMQEHAGGTKRKWGADDVVIDDDHDDNGVGVKVARQVKRRKYFCCWDENKERRALIDGLVYWKGGGRRLCGMGTWNKAGRG